MKFTVVRGIIALACIAGISQPVHARLNPWSRLCRQLLSNGNPFPEVEDYDVKLPALPMDRPSEGTCLYSATVSHLQNRLGRRFSLDFINFVRMRANVGRVLNGDRPAWLNTESATVLRPDAGTVFWEVFSELKALNALAPASHWHPPESLTSPLKRLAEELALVFRDRPSSPMQMFTARINASLRRFVAGETTRAAIDEQLAPWDEAIDPAFDAAAFTRDVTSGWDVLEMSVKSASHPRGKVPLGTVERRIIEHLDQGYNVMLAYETFPGREYDQSHLLTGPEAVRVSREMARSRADITGHAVTIEGYIADWRGQPRWFLIRDWFLNGPEEPHYRHMRIDFFRVYARIVAYLRKV